MEINKKIAISVAVFSTFLAVFKVKDDNLVQAMLQAKSNAVDSWNEYQSKKIKDHIAHTAITQNEALVVLLGKERGKTLAASTQSLKADIERYAGEEKALQTKAKALEQEYDSLNFKDDQFDLSDACLDLSLMMLAMAALAESDMLFGISWLFGGFGITFGISAFLSWNFHPEWLVRFLT